MYIHSLTRLFRNGLRAVSFPLPSPVTFKEERGEIRALPNALPDNRVLVLPLTHDTPTCEAITVLADRVGGMLNKIPVEIGVRNIRVVGDEVHIPFFGLQKELPIGIVKNVSLTVDII